MPSLPCAVPAVNPPAIHVIGNAAILDIPA